MLLSMTGYGKSTVDYNGKTIIVDIKSLNGKTSDIRVKAPNNYRHKEIDIRNLVGEGAYRGKLEVTIEVSSEDGDGEYGLNIPLFKKYYSELKKIKDDLDPEDSTNLFAAVVRIPNVISAQETEMDDEEWDSLVSAILGAIKELNRFRATEGVAMEKDLSYNISTIGTKLEEVLPFEKERVDRLRVRLQKNLDDFLGNEKVDQNRFEQEVLFYLEKLDINEEKVRLSQHLKYFMSVIESDEVVVGKKLSFISQEIGREINTLGAKAQHSDIQQIVVQMKDALEQIKEQLANVV